MLCYFVDVLYIHLASIALLSHLRERERERAAEQMREREREFYIIFSVSEGLFTLAEG